MAPIRSVAAAQRSNGRQWRRSGASRPGAGREPRPETGRERGPEAPILFFPAAPPSAVAARTRATIPQARRSRRRHGRGARARQQGRCVSPSNYSRPPNHEAAERRRSAQSCCAPRHRCERSTYDHLGTFYVQAWRVARSSGHAGPAASSFNSCSPMDGLEDSAGSNGIEHGCKQYASVLACSCCCCCCLLLGLRGRRVGCF